jgi:hypothetical protein
MLRLIRSMDNSDHDVVRRIAEGVAAEMISQLAPLAERMSTAEFRGYVRAHSRAFVRRKLQAAGSSELFPSGNREDNEAAVLDGVVHSVVRSFARGSISPIPLPHVSLRKAA